MYNVLKGQCDERKILHKINYLKIFNNFKISEAILYKITKIQS